MSSAKTQAKSAIRATAYVCFDSRVRVNRRRKYVVGWRAARLPELTVVNNDVDP